MDIIIEELNENHDYNKYCNLLKQLTTIDTSCFSSQEFFDNLKLINSNPYHKIFIAIYNQNIIASITVLIEPKIIHNLSRVSHIEDVVVDISYRSFGIGKKLMNKAIEYSKEMNCYKIILDCSENNISYYNKFNFIKKETQMALYINN